jgi:hypothetical protein
LVDSPLGEVDGVDRVHLSILGTVFRMPDVVFGAMLGT